MTGRSYDKTMQKTGPACVIQSSCRQIVLSPSKTTVAQNDWTILLQDDAENRPRLRHSIVLPSNRPVPIHSDEVGHGGSSVSGCLDPITAFRSARYRQNR